MCNSVEAALFPPRPLRQSSKGIRGAGPDGSQGIDVRSDRAFFVLRPEGLTTFMCDVKQPFAPGQVDRWSRN